MRDRPDDGIDRPQRATASFRADPSSASEARRFVAQWCRAWAVPGVAEDAEIVVTELVENAVRHTQDACEVTMERRGGGLTIRVADFGHNPPRMRRPAPDVAGGRGLLMVDTIARRWGFESTDSGKVVWADLAVQPHTVFDGRDGDR